MWRPRAGTGVGDEGREFESSDLDDDDDEGEVKGGEEVAVTPGTGAVGGYSMSVDGWPKLQREVDVSVAVRRGA